MARSFDHEKLHVYQTPVQFVVWIQEVLEKIPKTDAIYQQLDRASSSIPLNIAEGNGKFTARDRCKFFDIARGSALECAAALDILVAKSLFEESQIFPGKEILVGIVSMLVGLIKSNSPDRVYESTPLYGDQED